MSAYGELLGRVNAINGVRGSMIVAAEDGLVVEADLMIGVPGPAVAALVVEADLMIGVPGPAVAALVASLFGRARRSTQAAAFGTTSFLQVEGANGLLFAAAPQELGDLLLVVVAESWVNVGLVRLEAARVAGALG